HQVLPSALFSCDLVSQVVTYRRKRRGVTWYNISQNASACFVAVRHKPQSIQGIQSKVINPGNADRWSTSTAAGTLEQRKAPDPEGRALGSERTVAFVTRSPSPPRPCAMVSARR